MKIRYSGHLLTRLRMRDIPEHIPRLVYGKATRRFFDTETGHAIAVSHIAFFGKERDVAVTYREDHGEVLLITIHPLKQNQIDNRLKTGRWKPHG